MHLIAGATGSLGGKIATRLLEQGDAVRAIVRSESPARGANRHTPPDALAGADVVEADLTRPETLQGICDGVKAVVFTASGTKRMPPDTVEAVDVDGAGALANEAATAGVEQFVYMSTLGASPEHPAFIFQNKGLGEQAVKNSGVDHTILHPVKFMQDWIGFVLGAQLESSGRIQLVGAGDVSMTFVNEDDVADLAVAVLGRSDTIGETIPFATEAADFEEVIRRFSQITGSTVDWSTLGEGELVDTVDPSIAEVVTGLLSVPAMSPPDDRTFPEVAARFGLRPTGIDDFLRTALG